MPRTIEIQAYKFYELSEAAKQKALEKFWDINVDYDWWQLVYEDAENIGLKITGFDLERNKHCTGDFTQDSVDVANAIVDTHGKNCDTYKTAKDYLIALEELESKAKDQWDTYKQENDEEDLEYFDFDGFYEYEFETERDELGDDFKRAILEDYADILEKEYEYLTSEEVIVEFIEANEYEFDEDGNKI